MEELTAEQEARLEEVYALERAAYEQEQKGNLNAFLALRRQALAMEESILDADSDYLASSIDSLAIALYEAKHYHEAEQHFRRAMAIHSLNYGSESLEVSSDLSWLAFLYDDLKQYRKALQFLSASIRMTKRLFGPQLDQKKQTMIIYADLLDVTGRKVRARHLKKRWKAPNP